MGIARISDPPPGWWGEISGSVVTVRRTILSGNIQEAIFVNHPYTHNMELTFHREPMTSQLLPAGSTYTLQEEISFREPGTQSGTEDNAVVVAVDIPTSVTASSTISATVTLRNTGDTTWVEPADHAGGTRLGSLSENALTWVPGAAGGYSNSPTDQRLFVPGPVAPTFDIEFFLSHGEKALKTMLFLGNGQQQGKQHRTSRVVVIGHQADRKQRKCLAGFLAQEPGHQDASLSVWEQLDDCSPVRGNAPPTATAPANRAHRSDLPFPVDPSGSHRIRTFPHGLKVVTVWELDG